MKITILILILLITCICFNTYAQQHKVDSLINELKSVKQDSTKCNIYIAIGIEFNNQNNYDKAKDYLFKALKISEELNNKNNTSICCHYLGYIYTNQGNYDKALNYFLKALKISEEVKNTKRISQNYNSIGGIYTNMGNYDKALNYYFKALKISEETKNIVEISCNYNNIGIINYKMGNYDKALSYYFKAISFQEKLSDKFELAKSYINVGVVYMDIKNYDKSLYYLSNALTTFQELNNKKGLSYCYNNIGSIYYYKNIFHKAIDFYLKSLKIKEELGDKYGIVIVYNNLLSIYISLSDSSKSTEKAKLNTAIEYGNKAYKLAIEIGALPLQNDVSNNIQKAYTKLGNYKEALKYANIFITTNDSLYEEEKTKAIANVEAKYQNEKKQLQIEKLGKEKKLQISENKKQKIVIYSFVFGFLLIFGFSIILTRLFLQKKKANILLAEQKTEIEIQHEIVIEQKKEITDSINYAKRIQTAVLQTSQFADNILGEHFVLFKPKDIVSGDFYWGKYVNEYLILAVADCTGHGVPGAFMSMLGVSFLNEIVSKKEITNTNLILDQLRNNVIESLQQKGISGEQKDGMDISLITINTNTLELQYSGANNSVYIITSSNNELKELKPDKMPIAIYENMTQFTSYNYQLQKGDTIYLMTDGYEDQFGGAKGKKFMSKQLKNLLITINNVNMEEQKQILETTIADWIGVGEQIDDITVVGVRI